MSRTRASAAAHASIAARAGEPVEIGLSSAPASAGWSSAVEGPIVVPYAEIDGLPRLDRAEPRGAAGDRAACADGGSR